MTQVTHLQETFIPQMTKNLFKDSKELMLQGSV